MTYKKYSQTASGWEISTDPTAPSNMQWKATHPDFGEQFFETHEEVFPAVADFMFKLMEHAVMKGAPAGLHYTPAALCLNCGGQWAVPGVDDWEVSKLEGVCMDCQADSDAEKPLMFTTFVSLEPSTLPVLPKGWLSDEG